MRRHFRLALGSLFTVMILSPSPWTWSASAPQLVAKTSTKGLPAAAKTQSSSGSNLTVTLDQNLVGFLDKGGSLNPKSTLFLGKIGKFLVRNKDWDRMEIVDYIQGPNVGKEARQLAETRAQAAEEALVDGGAPEFKLKSLGKIKISPTEESWIELRMSGVKDTDNFRDGFEKVKRNSR